MRLYIGVHDEVYLQMDRASIEHYSGAGEAGSWRDNVAAISYNKEDGTIRTNYESHLYLGGGNICCMTIL